MKNIIIVILALLIVCPVYGQRKRRNKKADELAAREAFNASSSDDTAYLTEYGSLEGSVEVTRLGIYDSEINESTIPFKMGHEVHTVVAETEAYQEGLVISGYIEGFFRPDYTTYMGKDSAATYLLTAESLDEENVAMNFVAFDGDAMGHLNKLALDKNNISRTIYLYGIPLTTKEASMIFGDSIDVIGGQGVPSFYLASVSLEKIENPGVILINSTLIRSASNILDGYNKGQSFRSKVQLIGKDELEHRTFVPERMIDWLHENNLLVSRTVATLKERKSGGLGKLQDGGTLPFGRRTKGPGE
jgi:hypothetical protein